MDHDDGGAPHHDEALLVRSGCPVALVGAAGIDAGAVLLHVTRPLDILAVVTPGLGRAEALDAQFAVEHAGHLDAVCGEEDVAAVGQVALRHWQGRVPGLGAAEVAGGVALEATDGGRVVTT